MSNDGLTKTIHSQMYQALSKTYPPPHLEVDGGVETGTTLNILYIPKRTPRPYESSLDNNIDPCLLFHPTISQTLATEL